MNEIILLKLGEVVLKGLNRRSFEQKLMGNVRRRLLGLGEFQVSCMQSTIYVEPLSEDADMDAAFAAMQDVFGVVKISRAAACEKNADAIAGLAIDYLKDDTTVLEQEPFRRLTADGEMTGYCHKGFWQCMDTQREKKRLEELWQSGKAPWKIW